MEIQASGDPNSIASTWMKQTIASANNKKSKFGFIRSGNLSLGIISTTQFRFRSCSTSALEFSRPVMIRFTEQLHNLLTPLAGEPCQRGRHAHEMAARDQRLTSYISVGLFSREDVSA